MPLKILTASVLLAFNLLFAVSSVYAAVPVLTPTNPHCTSTNPCPASLWDVDKLVQGLITIIVPAAFVALVFMLTWAGVRFLTSGGEQDNVKKARETATWAVVGMLFLIIAWLVLKFVSGFTGNTDILNFCIKYATGTDSTGKTIWQCI